LPNSVPNAGLLSAAVLAQRIELGGLIDSRLRLAKQGPSCGAKALSVIGSMLAGGDSIDDVAVLRARQTGGFRTPSKKPFAHHSLVSSQQLSPGSTVDPSVGRVSRVERYRARWSSCVPNRCVN
jgi:hypothetical protein